MFGSPITEEFDTWQRQQAEQIIADAVRVGRTAVEDAELDIRTEIVSGAVVPALVDLSKQVRLVVVGSRGMGIVGRALLGSVSSALIRHARCPIAVIHGAVAPEHSSGPVVVGIDGSPASEVATALAFDEAALRHADLVAVHAYSEIEWPEVIPLPWSTIVEEAGEVLSERLAGWQERYPDVVVHKVVVRDRPIQHLLEQSESAQLVVLGSHGRGGFAGMLLGSVSSAVAHQIHTPLIVARND